MIRVAEPIFIDTGAWIALARRADPLHERARSVWQTAQAAGARLRTSVPVVLETFTFLDRNTDRDTALAWKESIETLAHFRILEVTVADLGRAWRYFGRRDLHRLSLVDATSFVVMQRERIRVAFAFDHHFTSVGFRVEG